MDENQVSQLLKLENQLCFPLYASARLITQAYTEPLKKLNLTYAQYIVLLVLWESDGLNVKDIGKKLFLDSGTLTPVLNGLHKKGFIIKKRDTRDDRQVRSYLTAKSKKLKPKAAEMSYNLFCSSGLEIEEAVNLRLSAQSLVSRLSQRTALLN